LNTHKAAIGELEESSRAGYQEVRSLASSPELAPLVYPAAIQAMHADDNWGKHLYVSDADVFPAPLNKVEAGVIQEELNSASVVGWLRNTDRKPWALCVPYEMDGETRPMYPDFLVVRSEGKHLVVDLLEPHTISLADAPAKAAGLARFADQHADKFGRIEFIMVDGKTVKRVDLVDETVRKKVKAAKLPAQLRELFEST